MLPLATYHLGRPVRQVFCACGLCLEELDASVWCGEEAIQVLSTRKEDKLPVMLRKVEVKECA
jgi:hypothetical protein